MAMRERVRSRRAGGGCSHRCGAWLRPCDRQASRRARVHRARDGRGHRGRGSDRHGGARCLAAARRARPRGAPQRRARGGRPRPPRGLGEQRRRDAPGPAWDHSDEEVRLSCEVNLLGVVWGSRAAVEVMRSGPGENRHIINVGSLAALGPVPGLAIYAATKHAVLGFTGSLQGDLMDAGIPITVHALCPDGADTPLLREHDDEPAASINWSGPRLLTADEVAEHAVALLDSSRLVRVIPPWRGWGARAMAMGGRRALRAAPLLRRLGARHRVAFKDP